ncbi:MAG: DUF2167 domain-containing protein [Myxococcota bacterium]
MIRNPDPHRSVVARCASVSPAAVLSVLLLLAAPSRAQEQQAVGFAWQSGPTVAPLGVDLAEIDVPEGYMVLGARDTQRLMEYLENPITGQEVGTLAPEVEDVRWFIVFEWNEMGYVPDDDADDLDADGILESIREGTEAANLERRERGWSTMEIVGWQEEPHYDETTHNLTWAIIGRAGESENINRIVKLLGRRGVMTATLVTDLNVLHVASVESDQILAGYRFRQGSTYAEYIPGTDRLAEVGLGALIVGGAGAALIKSGLLARFWKLIVAGLAVVGGGLAKLFGRKNEQYPGSTA